MRRDFIRAMMWAAALLTLASCESGPGSAHDGPTTAPAAATSSPVSPVSPTSSSPSPSLTLPQPVTPGLTASRRTTGSAAVALTFDDGPDPAITPRLLDMLKANHVTATFCLVGSRVHSYPRLTARIAAEGHTLCNHSWSHAEHLYQRTDAQILHDLQRTNAEIRKAAPGAPIHYFRAPYGNFTPRLTGLAARLDLTSLGWSVDDQCYLIDRYGTGPAMVRHMSARVRRDTRPGSIILSHDLGKPQTLNTYRQLLPWLRTRYGLAAMPAGGLH
ncbi:polysaccharide deacetylase family protein [Paractinoplanes ferrugineus]|uniref:polysaccharide deacetylase family protein n=1 Tax=Paractinoplanes ferrugineus TaxID=113564 RepID=UPI001EF2D62A|nr:polysaccharide deacetylase family protein [Actinoplanes ferrugineus]